VKVTNVSFKVVGRRLSSRSLLVSTEILIPCATYWRIQTRLIIIGAVRGRLQHNSTMPQSHHPTILEKYITIYNYLLLSIINM